MNYVNEVVLQGTIVGKFVTPKTVTLTINTGNATKVPNYPRVVFFGELRDDIVSNYKKGDHVKVTANIQSSMRNEKNKGRSLINIFGDGIEPTKTVMESTFNVSDNNSYKPYVNSIQLAGSITRIKPITDNLFNVTVLTRKNNRLSLVTLAYYTNNAQAFTDNYKVKDEVFVIGNIQTAKKNFNGETRYFQNYVATNFAKQ